MSKMLSAMLAVCTVGAALGTEPINIGSRLELLVDDYLIDKLAGGAELRLHHPTARQVVLVHDAPWEGSGSGYHTIFRDGSIYRMYYKAWHLAPKEGKLEVPHETFGAYAQSVDGIRWVKPQLGLFEFEGSRDNNIVWMGKGSHDFTPFRDTNPKCKPGEEYKSVGQGLQPTGLYAFKSRDGIHWEFLQEKPILTEAPFDTQNVAFWDSVHHVYRTYVRNFRDGQRDIQTAVSKDFRDWTELAWLEYPGAPKEQLYTNQIKPYYRAPHIFIAFPTRYIERFNMRLCGYCIMANHWHLLLWPIDDGDLSEFMRWITLTHTQRYHTSHGTVGIGHLYQGRFKSFPVQDDSHYLTVVRYIEANPVRAGVAKRANDWPWSSFAVRKGLEAPFELSDGPLNLPPEWDALVHRSITDKQITQLQNSIKRGAPLGDSDWTTRTASRMNLESTLRPKGRPKKSTT